ncbi:TonB-dependent receptor [Pseudocolwellia agarivorans]|uniref:TonB-dependent receptor n=1 Tax=Pseudocolwellia agarivorans TaxID=1911682 RepID=UPI0009874D22|nr:TonB-dependent receptor [Pseudocolwellia agarivorans]
MEFLNYSLLAIAISTSFSAAANSMEALSDDNVERMIVTGSRMQENIDEVPASISIIDSKTISQDLLTTAELQTMLALHVPGMGADTGTNSNSGQSLRGRNVLIMIDGVPQSTPLRNGKLGIRSLDPSVIERIEVVKGATSIYGNGAAGGVINYITKQATSDKALSGRVAVNSNFSAVKLEDSVGRRLDVAIDGTVGKLDYVVSLVSDENGVIRDAEGDALGLQYGLSNFRSDNLFTKFNYYIDSSRSVQFTYNYFEGQQHSDYIAVDSNLNTGIKSQAIKNVNNLDVDGDPQGPRGNHNVKLQYRDMELTNNTDFTADAYWQRIENVFFYSTKFKDENLGLVGGQSMITSEKKGLRLNFNSVFDFNNVEAKLIYGADILNDLTAQPLVDGRMWTPEMDMSNIAGYVQAKLIFSDNWVLKAGVRQESIEIDVDDFSTLMICKEGKQCTVPVAVTGGMLDYDATTYNIGLRYSNNEYFSPFISYSEGFDIANIGSLLRNAKFNELSGLDTEASIVKNSEIGFSSIFDNVRLEMAAFYSTNNYGGNLVADEATETYVLERASQKVWGYEIAVDVDFTEQLDAGISYSWSEGKNKETDSYLDAGSINPPKITLYANYQASENLRLAINYISVQSRDRFEPKDGKYSGKTAPVSSYNVVNTSVSYVASKAVKLSVGIENLFNSDYYPHASQSHALDGWNVKGKGRTANIGLSYSF